MAQYTPPELLLVGAAQQIVLASSGQQGNKEIFCSMDSDDLTYFDELAW